ncbi:MAG TPA: DUF192 domain-containing protein [Methylocella sp.]|nr:DUF192 domain-containing protein [Methylocella sp.]
MNGDRPPSFLCRMEKRLFVVLGFGLLLAGGVLVWSAAGVGFGKDGREVCAPGAEGAGRKTSSPHAELGRLTLVTASERQDFLVKIMSRPCELERGLMFRRRLRAEQGMVFVLPREQIAPMWMKNTYIPLDMIFVANWKVVSVAEDTTPLSEKLIFPVAPVTRVIEVNAGTVARIGLRPGDTVELVPVVD